MLSVVVLAWDQLHHTVRCVDSIRANTDVPYELVIVDNGSAADGRSFAERAADTAVCLDENVGFAAGMNRGLAAARGEWVCFLNNDTAVPAGWAGRLRDTVADNSRCGFVVPAVTAAANSRTVRSAPGDAVSLLDPFELPPSGVVVFGATALMRELGGWDENLGLAGGEDLDLAFKVWVNDLDIVFDSRVLVEHVGKGTAATKLPDWRAQWHHGGRLFLQKWMGETGGPMLAGCEEAVWRRNRRTARAVATWMDGYYRARERRFPGKRFAGRALTQLERIRQRRI